MKVEEMEVFKLSHSFTIEIYKITKNYPKEEIYSLVSQMRRSALSICMNLSEGYYRYNNKEFKHFINIARGSAGELKYQLVVSLDLSYITVGTYNNLNEKIETILKMLTNLIKSLN